MTLSQIYGTTPISRAMASASSEEVKRESKLFDVAYVVAREDLPFTKYPLLIELERRHGVRVGQTYATEHKCKEFTMLIGETFREAALNELKMSRYFAILMDSSTDSSVKEKELVYVLFVCADGKVKCCLLCMKDVADATAPGIKTLLENALADLGVEDWQRRLVTKCVDGAAVNLGVHQGLSALLRQELPWLVAVHCLNHRLDLAVKNAFANTYMDESPRC